MSEHEPRARYCTEIVGIPVSELRDDLTCPACDEGIQLMMLDPDVEVLAPPAHVSVTPPENREEQNHERTTRP